LMAPVYLSHIARPDLSNLIKFIEDIAIGILYGDDSIIAEIYARKCYDATPRTEFELIQLER
jgi:Holliday junction resolvase RusA-like endonuclease